MSKKRLVLFTILLITLVFTVYSWWNSDQGEDYVEQQAYDDEVQSQYYTENTETDEEEDNSGVDFEKLLKRNEEVVGWIKIDGTPVNYPVLIHEDNDYYLSHNLDNEHSVSGSVFVDSEYRTEEYLENPLRKNPFRTSPVILLHGHNMGSWTDVMFTSLKSYRDEEYFKKHSVVDVYIPLDIGSSEVQLTSYKYTYDIVSVRVVKSDDELYTRRKFGTSSEEKEWYNEQLEKSLYDCGPTTVYLNDSTYLILSTCANDGNGDNRIVLICRRRSLLKRKARNPISFS